MNVLITGASGFIGRNLAVHLQERNDCVLIRFDENNSEEDLRAALMTADVVCHLAGVNRPEIAEQFEIGNAGLTRRICDILSAFNRSPTIVMSSSIQAELDNPYGISKRRAEEALDDFAARTGARIATYRLKNVFGKWCRPNYNSVVATFCHNIANDLPIHISDPSRGIDLMYIDDVVAAFLAELPEQGVSGLRGSIPSFQLTLGDLARRLQSFRDMRTQLVIPDFSERFNQQLYATYLSYFPGEFVKHSLEKKSDQRGWLAEFVKSQHFGSMFISRTKPGVTRGNHYHHTKTEKFLVVEGDGMVRMRQIESAEVLEYPVHGDNPSVIDIPPGYTHSIENIGAGEMVTLFWASEIFDPTHPDTSFVPVLTSDAVHGQVTV